jgi:hypothetical protein
MGPTGHRLSEVVATQDFIRRICPTTERREGPLGRVGGLRKPARTRKPGMTEQELTSGGPEHPSASTERHELRRGSQGSLRPRCASNTVLHAMVAWKETHVHRSKWRLSQYRLRLPNVAPCRASVARRRFHF